MKERRAVKRTRWGPWILGLFVLVSFTVLVLLQTSNLWKRLSVETASDTLLLYALSSLNFIALVVFGFIFLRSIVKLMRERRAFQLGSRLKTKMLLYFAAVSLLPIFAMAGFSYLFMNRALERWFTSIPENVVRAPLAIEERANSDRVAILEATARMLATSLEGRPVSGSELEKILQTGDLGYVAVLDGRNNTLASAGGEMSGPEFDLIRSGRVQEAVLRDGVGVDAAVAQMADGRRFLLATKPRPPESVTQMVDTTLSEFDRMKEQNSIVRQIGLLTLGVLTFLLIFASAWAAFYIARGLTAPIRALAEGAEEIARGKLGHQVDVFAEDELALLVSAFNEMSSKLEANAAELADRRRYIETVLLSLPTGVISIDSDGRISTINPAARSMLKLQNEDFVGTGLFELIDEADREVLERLSSRARRTGHASEQMKIRSGASHGEGLSAAITATALPENRGAVLVIEDLSELLAAQRAAAWQEVARRMAHEIKNPLTPIQLSAERIAKRFKADPQALAGGPNLVRDQSQLKVAGLQVEDANAKVVRDGTETILREVLSLKSMVDEFSQFARLPEARLETGDLNEAVNQAIDLYVDRAGVSIESRLSAGLPQIMLDIEHLKRVFVNLIDNAIEAMDENVPEPEVRISTRFEPARDLVIAEVSDNGRGIEPADYGRLFQPYFSTKGRGTGLGLAIVNRIVAEHHGRIKAGPNSPRGAKFIIELPAVA